MAAGTALPLLRCSALWSPGLWSPCPWSLSVVTLPMVTCLWSLCLWSPSPWSLSMVTLPVVPVPRQCWTCAMDGEHPQLVPWAGLGVAAVAVLSPALGWSQGCRGHSPMALRCSWGWCCSTRGCWLMVAPLSLLWACASIPATLRILQSGNSL